MNEEPSEFPENQEPPPRAAVRRNRRWSVVWVVPMLAAALAGWLVWQHYSGRGKLAWVRFNTADGIVAGSTEVRCRSVRVGTVENVELAPDLQSVVVALRVEPDAVRLLRKGTRFWVVRPRVSASGLSGLGTLITGAYVELDPGEGPEEVTHFDGLEAPPVTKSSVPGLRLTLKAESGGSLGVDSPVYYRGFEVGRVELRAFDPAEKTTRFEVFIHEDYAGLVTENTVFWNNSGIDVSAGANGFRVRTPSFQAMLAGGASFDLPPGVPAGKPAEDGAVFRLYPDETAARDAVFKPAHRCLLLFNRTVRGLHKGAPVEFRGIPLGRVADVSLQYGVPGDPRVPVVIEIDPAILVGSVPDAPGEEDHVLERAVRRGLRARLGTASLLTGALFIDLDFVPEAPREELTRSGEFDVIPTHGSGLVQLEDKVNAILAKIEALPLEDLVTKFTSTAEEAAAAANEARAALAEARKLLARDATQSVTEELNATLGALRQSIASFGPSGAVQGDLRRTLDELRAALRSFKTLADTIEEKPNSLLFGRESSGDPVPKAKKKQGAGRP